MHKQFFEMLQKDHEEVKSLLEGLEKTSDGAVKKTENLFAKLKKELLPHMRAEEKQFYPVLKEKKEAKQDVMESLEEQNPTPPQDIEKSKHLPGLTSMSNRFYTTGPHRTITQWTGYRLSAGIPPFRGICTWPQVFRGGE